MEKPIIRHLKAMGWEHIPGPQLRADEAAELDPRTGVIHGHLRAAVLNLNRNAATGRPWLTEAMAARMVTELSHALGRCRSSSLLAANREVTNLLLSGCLITVPTKHGNDKDRFGHYLDWRSADPFQHNRFLVVDQLRLRSAEDRDAVLDLVLYVNGIPLVVIECKSPDLSDPIGDAVHDLRAYAGQPLDADPRDQSRRPHAVPEPFAAAQLLIAASGESAALGTISSAEEHFAVWRSVQPTYADEEALRRKLVADRVLAVEGVLTEQHKLVAVVLKPGNLLNILRNYIFELPLRTGPGKPSRTVKIVCRHQQFRAVEKIVRKLRTRASRLFPGVEEDGRGGVIWHTQGSGKSLTMTFLVRRLHRNPDPELNAFTVLVVTDRRDLQTQLGAALRHSQSRVDVAKDRTEVESMLAGAGEPGARAVVFTLIQKYLGRIPGFVPADEGDDSDLMEEFDRAQAADDPESADEPETELETEPAVAGQFVRAEPISTSDRILVLVDEAHRSHTSALHACLRASVPNAARIGFTGTPIMEGKHKDTARIFGLEPGGRFLDEYPMVEAEADGVVVPIRYEGRTGPGRVREGTVLDGRFENLIAPLSDADRQRLRARWTTLAGRDVAESVPMIEAKARDMLSHYVRGPLYGGFKAQVAAVSRLAAVLYRDALSQARDELLARISGYGDQPPHDRPVSGCDEDELLLLRAWQRRDLLRRLVFVPVVSEGKERKAGLWKDWTDPQKQKKHVEEFLVPFPESGPGAPWSGNADPTHATVPLSNPWSSGPAAVQPEPQTEVAAPIAFLIVKSMLLTGFDAPIEQVLYLDRPIQGAELLQAVARVNRPAQGKENGLVVDYYGVLADLGVTLAGYRNGPPSVSGLRSTAQAVTEMNQAAGAVADFLARAGADGADTPDGMSRAIRMLQPPELRAEYDQVMRAFLNAMGRVLPHQDGLSQVPNAQQWALLQKRVHRHARDLPGGGFSYRGISRQVRALIAEHLELPEIEQVIPPVSILAPDFDEVVGRIPDVELSVSEQVQALRYHLEERLRQDDLPVHRELSEELERILAECDDRWTEIAQRLGPVFAAARQAEQDDPEIVHLSPLERALHAKLAGLVSDLPALSGVDADQMRDLTVELAGVISEHVRTPAYAADTASQRRLETVIWECLEESDLVVGPDALAALEILVRGLGGYVRSHREQFASARRR
ncbi:type I restriction endonuclease subunit R [Streptacidiphilus sp. P02-A3a]|nr:type I restriction endonuclease subunit R [Streptacidiphilus sp. P02-A3a]